MELQVPMPKLLPILISLALPCAAQLRQDIEYSKPGGISLTLDAFTPPGPGPFPAVIIVHGGGWVNGTKTSYVPPLFDPLSKAGYAWFTINYRMAPAHHFPAPIEDLEAAIRWVKKNANTYKVDPRRIALMGESAGGQIAAYVAARGKGDTKVKAAVIFYGPHDLWDRAQKAHEVSANVKQYLAIICP